METDNSSYTKTFILMHKDIKVAKITVDINEGVVLDINSVYDEKHLPFIFSSAKSASIKSWNRSMREWWMNSRKIPESRLNIVSVNGEIRPMTIEEILLENRAQTLTDHYWLKDEFENVKYEDVSYFNVDAQSGRNSKLSELLVAAKRKDDSGIKYTDLFTPSITLTGRQPKKWENWGTNGEIKPVFVKSGFSEHGQEAFNEEIGSAVSRRLQVPCVEYRTEIRDGIPYSLSDAFTSKSKEFVTADDIMRGNLKSNRENFFDLYLRSCEDADIPRQNAIDLFKGQAIVDSIIANSDRHTNNFGFLRDSDTMKIVGNVPAFDFENSLWTDFLFRDGRFYLIDDTGKVSLRNRVLYADSKPFRATHREQLKTLKKYTDLSFDKEALHGIEDEVNEKLTRCTLPDERKHAVLYGIRKRIELTEEIINK